MSVKSCEKLDKSKVALTIEADAAAFEAAIKATMEDADYLAAASEFVTDYKDAAATAALIEEQQAFTEGLSNGFWYE